ncbi:hypothetical protein DER29_0330 [Micromonospora sp. M71_S20]|nr:hypothetical protein DER29_0330 [Micromonospora sp. M71_S20]
MNGFRSGPSIPHGEIPDSPALPVGTPSGKPPEGDGRPAADPEPDNGPATARADRSGSADAGPARTRRSRYDLLAALVALAGALLVTGRGWLDAHGRLLGSRPNDQGFNEWMLAYAAHAVTHLENPFFTTLQNAPDGVNLMTNVGMQLPGLVLAPLTLIFGAPVAYLFFITVNLAATAYAWYHVLSRHVVSSRMAAFIGGLFCAFAPALVSHSNGHPHITAQWLVPFIVWRVVRLIRGGAVVRNGLLLSALVAVQFFVGLEILFLTAIGCAMGLLGWLIVRPRAALAAVRPLLGSLAVTAVVILLITAYPLWMQFAGPQHRVGHPGDPDAYALKLSSFVAYATESVGGGPTSARGLVANTTEQASFYGWPLVILLLGVILWLRREVVVQVLAVIGVLSALFSIGTTWTWGTRRTDVPAPFALIKDLPVVDSLVVSRFALITTVVVGVLLAIAVDRAVPALRRSPQGRPLTGLAAAVLLVVLLPVAPTPLPAQGREPVPHFVTSGKWHDHVAEGRTMVPVPVKDMTSIYWGSAALAGFAVPQGYFLGPVSKTDSTGRWGVDPRPTAALLTAVARGERDASISPAEREQAIVDVRHWKADAVVLPVRTKKRELRTVLDALYGPGQRIEDVWLWDVRPYTR